MVKDIIEIYRKNDETILVLISLETFFFRILEIQYLT